MEMLIEKRLMNFFIVQKEMQNYKSSGAKVFPLISNYCTSCHSYPGSGGVNLDSYAGVQSFAVTGQLYPTLLHDPNGIIMPPLPAAGLDSKLIKRWIDQGALNN